MPRRAPPTRSTSAAAYAALLRGINVGGKNRLAMADLVELFAAAGCADVRTYVQSGNVVFRASAAVAKRVPAAIERAIEAELGLRVPVLLRGARELARVATANPFLTAGADTAALHVAFLADAPGKRGAALDPARSPGDSFELRGRELYLHLPNGVGRTKLTNAYLDAKLATTSTLRNWRTVLQLVEMTRELG